MSTVAAASASLFQKPLCVKGACKPDHSRHVETLARPGTQLVSDEDLAKPKFQPADYVVNGVLRT